MTPLEVRRLIFEAALTENKNLALEMCKEVRNDELFIGIQARATGHEKYIVKSTYPGRCGTCGLEIPIGASIYWGKGVGQWHEECYQKEGNHE